MRFLVEKEAPFEEFQRFWKSAKNIFEGYALEDSRHKRFQSKYSFYVTPDRSLKSATDDPRLIRVFFGNRPTGFVCTSQEGESLKVTMNSASGVALQYYYTDYGSVICALFPAYSKDLRPVEDSIILDVLKPPFNLESRSKKHWKYFLSYMEGTSIDGTPGFTDKIRLFVLYNLKRRVVKKVAQETRNRAFWREAGKFIFKVGLSGILILPISLCMNNAQDQAQKERHGENIRQMEELEKAAYSIESSLKILGKIGRESVLLQSKSESTLDSVIVSLERSNQEVFWVLEEIRKSNQIAQVVRDSLVGPGVEVQR